MAGLLKEVMRDFDERMALRRKMLRHLGVELSEDATLTHREDIRATLIGCSQCSNREDCAMWMQWGRLGTPDNCYAADAFMRLQLVSQAEARQFRHAG